MSLDNWDWVARKLNVVKRFGKSSFPVKRACGRGSVGHRVAIPGSEYATHGGAFLIRIKGHPAPIGAHIISGLAQDVDHRLAKTAIAGLLQIRDLPSVVYYASK